MVQSEVFQASSASSTLDIEENTVFVENPPEEVDLKLFQAFPRTNGGLNLETLRCLEGA